MVSVIRGDSNSYDCVRLYINYAYMSDMTISAVLDPGAHPSFHICMGNLSVTWLITQMKIGSCRKKSCALGSTEKKGGMHTDQELQHAPIGP